MSHDVNIIHTSVFAGISGGDLGCEAYEEKGKFYIFISAKKEQKWGEKEEHQDFCTEEPFN